MRTIITCAILMAWITGGCEEQAAPVGGSTQTAAVSGQHINSEKIEASLSAANQYLQTGEIVEAEAILRTLIGRAPEEPRGHELLGQTLMQKALNAEKSGDSASAIDLKKQAYGAYLEAVRCDSHTAGLQHSAGLMAMAAGESDAALTHFQAAEKLDSSNPQYALFAAQLLMQMKRLDDAQAALQRVLAASPQEPYAHASMAMLLLERGEFEQALQEISTARGVLPDDVGLRAQHAKVYRRMNQPRKALELLVGLEANDRAQEAVAFEIASAYDMLGDPSKAGAAWESCAQVNPQAAPDRVAYAALQAARMYLKAGETGDALRCAQVAERVTPDAAEVKDVMAQVRSALRP
jgi:tetratricopeptide (TPR) repeat protein